MMIRRAVRFLSIRLFFLITFITILFLFLGQLHTLRRTLFDWGMAKWEEHADIRITAESLEGFIPFQLTARNVEWIENGKPWISSPEVTLTFKPWSLLTKRMIFPTLTVRDPVIHRRQSGEGLPDYTYPPSDWSVELNRIEIINLTFGDEVIDSIDNPSLKNRLKGIDPIDGVLSLFFPSSERSFIVDADLLSQNNSKAFTKVHLEGKRFVPPSEREPYGWDFSLTTTVSEDTGGIIGHFLGANNTPSFSTRADLIGPIETWTQVFGSDSPLTSPAITGSLVASVETPSNRTEALGKQIAIVSDVSLSRDRSTSFTNLRVDSALAFLRGHLGWNGEGVFQQTELETKIQCEVLQELSGLRCQDLISGKLTLEGDFSSPTFDLALTDQNFELFSTPLRAVDGRAKLTFEENQAFGSLTFSSNHKNLHASGYATMHWDHYQDLLIESVNLSIPGFSLNGSLNLLTGSGTINGYLKGECDRIAGCFDHFDQVLDGSASFSVQLRPTVAPETKLITQGFTIHADIWNYRDANSTASRLHIDTEGVGFKGPINATLRATVQDLRYRHMEISEAAFFSEIDQNQSFWPYRLDIHGDSDQQIELSSHGKWRYGSHSFAAAIDHFHAKAFRAEYSLSAPFSFNLEANKKEFTPIAVAVSNLSTGESGAFQMSGLGSEEELAATLSFQSVPVDLIAELYPELPFATTLSGHGSLITQQEKLTGQIALEMEQFRVTDEADAPFPEDLNAMVTFNLGTEAINVKGSAFTQGEEPMRFSMTLPFTICRTDLSFKKNPNTPLVGQINILAPVGNVLPLLTDDTNKLTGDLEVNLAFDGSLDHPRIHGIVHLRDGTYKSLATGIRFDHIDLRLQAQGNQIVITEGYAEDGSGGSVKAQGKFQFDKEHLYPFFIQLNTDKSTIFQSEEANVEVRGALALRGDRKKAYLKGDLEVLNAILAIPKKIPVTVPNLNVTYVGDAFPIPTEIKRHNGSLPLVDLNLHLSVPGTATLDGRGLHARWKGDVLLTGSLADPLIQGSLGMIDSQFEFGGRQLEISSGDLLFEGRPNEARINVQGEIQVLDIRAIVVLQGPIRSPQMRLYSSPELPQTEIASLILFNKHTAEITPLQGLQLAQTVGSLSGEKSGLDFLGNVRRSFSLDTLDIGAIETADGQEYAVRFGKYLWRGVQVSVNQSVTTDYRSIALEAELHPTIKLAGEIDEESLGKVSLKWKKDY